MGSRCAAAPGPGRAEGLAAGGPGEGGRRRERQGAHGALLLTQFCWGSAAVVNKLGLSGAGVSPLLFGLLREAAAAPLLLALVWLSALQGAGRSARAAAGREPVGLQGLRGGRPVAPGAPWPAARPLVARALPGVFIFIDQLCSLSGVALADPLSAAAWQPSQVIFTLLIGACLGMEALNRWRVLGALLTVIGALCLTFLDGADGCMSGGDLPRRYPKAGHLFFLANCVASSLEVVLWRRLLQHATAPLAHFAVMAESYLVAACLMAGAFLATSFSKDAVDFFCPECGGNAWHLPPQALWAVGYSVVFQTLLGYVSQAWALRHAESSLASLYATMQPLMAAIVTCALLLCGINPNGVLHWPRHELVGALWIVAGLLVAECCGGPATTVPNDVSSACGVGGSH